MEKLIVVVSKHHKFGWKFAIHWAKEITDGSVEILGVPDAKKEASNIAAIFKNSGIVETEHDPSLKGTPEITLQLIKLMNEVSDVSLMKVYSRQKNMTLFLNEVTQETINQTIRPRIEINIRRVILLLPQSGLPVYLRETLAEKTLFPTNRIEILPSPSRCLFNFIKDEKGLRYYISLTNEKDEISLQSKPVCVLSQEPCIVLLNNNIHKVENMEAKKLIPFFDKPYIPVPAATEQMYIKNFILKIIPKYEVSIEGLEMTELSPSRKAVLTLSDDFYQQATLILHFHYNNHKINPALRKTKFVELKEKDGNETICWFQRDPDWEKRLINKLIGLGLRLEGDNRFYTKSISLGAKGLAADVQIEPVVQQHKRAELQIPLNAGEKHSPFEGIVGGVGLISWLNEHRHDLSEFSIEQAIGKNYYMGTIRLESRLIRKIDWFDLSVDVILENFKIPLYRFRKHILNGKVEFVLPDKSVFVLPEEWFYRFYTLFMHGIETDDGIRIPKMLVGLLNESICEIFPETQRLEILKIRQLPDEQPVASPYLNSILYPYQKTGFHWLTHLYHYGLGGCLADDMGLGKTLQTITLLDYIYSQSDKIEMPPSTDGQLSLFPAFASTIPASLLVVPKSLLHNWHNELKKFGADLKVYIHAGNKRIQTKELVKQFDQYQLIITSYSIVRMDIDYFKAYPFFYVVLDESQYIKNPDSILYASINKLKASHRLVLTGTPIENSLTDLWAQFNFINPGLLGDFSFFKNNYIQPIKEKNKTVEKSLQQLIQPLFLRRTKEEVAPDLPALFQEIVYCDMTESQQEIYELEKNRIRNTLFDNQENRVKNNLIMLKGLMRLRLLANHPVLVDSDYQMDAGKFDQIILSFDSLRASGHKVLIFSSFVKHLKLLSAKFDQEGWKYAMLTGQTEDREAEIDKFAQNNDVHCFFISLKAGGTGLNLTAAGYVFIIDPWWNPAAEAQACSRAHRIGQDKNVFVYRFISCDTIEEKIIRLQQSKLQLFDTFIPSNNPLDQLDSKEVEELFR
ncbi:MAG: DEAD/DEAH box helicase [Tannerella sp.]|jgi:superfamily II DNA or RNA helicase|nr:DEAD/DEAH box helicase [Tannerella sp.]